MAVSAGPVFVRQKFITDKSLTTYRHLLVLPIDFLLCPKEAFERRVYQFRFFLWEHLAARRSILAFVRNFTRRTSFLLHNCWLSLNLTDLEFDNSLAYI